MTTNPTTSVSPTTVPTTDPNIPSAARAHTPSGAEAFVRYFYEQLNTAWSKPQSGLISALSATTCKTCAALEGSAVDLVSRQQRYRGNVFVVSTIASTGDSEVLVTGEQPPGRVIDNKGSVVRVKTTAQKAKFTIALTKSSGGWHIREMKVLR